MIQDFLKKQRKSSLITLKFQPIERLQPENKSAAKKTVIHNLIYERKQKTLIDLKIKKHYGLKPCSGWCSLRFLAKNKTMGFLKLVAV